MKNKELNTYEIKQFKNPDAEKLRSGSANGMEYLGVCHFGEKFIYLTGLEYYIFKHMMQRVSLPIDKTCEKLGISEYDFINALERLTRNFLVKIEEDENCLHGRATTTEERNDFFI